MLTTNMFEYTSTLLHCLYRNNDNFMYVPFALPHSKAFYFFSVRQVALYIPQLYNSTCTVLSCRLSLIVVANYLMRHKPTIYLLFGTLESYLGRFIDIGRSITEINLQDTNREQTLYKTL